ncbi:MAG: efflux RND transporter periplasmic adaptor subunit [Burkholderiales bacterium]|nr:efflux RND transporter periplasmic adaptor subunit [Burkholderiales bacterium]
MRQRLFLLALLGLLSACGRSGPSTAAAALPASAPPLLIAPEDLRTVSAGLLASGPVVSGSIEPERRADLRAEVGAVVLQVFKENGQPVRAGEPLVRLDDAAIRDALSSADEAARAAGQAYDQTERQLQRLRTLQQQGMTSQQSLDDAEVRRNNAQSDLVAAKARVAAARQQLQRTLIRAPFDGVVSDRQVSVGDTAQVGKALLKVIDPRSMRFEGLVSADRLAELKPGQRVRFRVNGYADGDFIGTVRRIDASANAATRQLAVIIDFNDRAAAPQVAGLFAEGRIEAGSSRSLMLPEGSIVRSGDAAYAWRLVGGGTGSLAKVAIQTGPRDPRTGDVPVLAGLAAGDRVLRNPGSTLLDGQRFELVGSGAAAKAALGAAPAPAPSAAKAAT